MPRLRPAPEPKKEELPPKQLKEAIDNGSMAGLGEEIVVEEPEIETEVEVEEPEPEPQPQVDEATIALQKQVEDLRKSEQIQRDIAAQNARELSEYKQQLNRVQRESQEYQITSIESAIAAAKAEADKAQLDIDNAEAIGDNKGRGEAYRRMARAEARLERLEEGKQAFEAQAKEQPVQQRNEQPVDIVDTWNLPPDTTSWLKSNRDFISSADRINALRYWADKAIKSGLDAHTPEHREWVGQKMREELGQQQVQQSTQPQPKQKGPIVSAPVSREVPGGDGKRPKGKVTLTREQLEIAKLSNLTPEEYAAQVIKLAEAKANGQYTGGQ